LEILQIMQHQNIKVASSIFTSRLIHQLNIFFDRVWFVNDRLCKRYILVHFSLNLAHNWLRGVALKSEWFGERDFTCGDFTGVYFAGYRRPSRRLQAYTSQATGVHLAGMHLTGVHLAGVHLADVHLKDRRASRRRTYILQMYILQAYNLKIDVHLAGILQAYVMLK
jgi:uncharacterized protein YjbI with pentapeptide repeats